MESTYHCELFPGVQSAAVNVVCELARKNPKNYLSLAPVFFKLMTTSTNNWMLIKIIKLVSVVLFTFILNKINQFSCYEIHLIRALPPILTGELKIICYYSIPILVIISACH